MEEKNQQCLEYIEKKNERKVRKIERSIEREKERETERAQESLSREMQATGMLVHLLYFCDVRVEFVW